MSENRILCLEVSGECCFFANINTQKVAALFECKPGLYCSKDIAWKPITKVTCKKCKHAKYQGITREQAIEKMAKGIGWAFDPYEPAKEEYDNIWNHVLLEGTKKHYKDVAEAALNALLSQGE